MDYPIKRFVVGAVIAPKGIGRWDRAWEIVDAPSGAFVIALTAWETSPSDEAALVVSGAYDGVLNAWREAASEYTTEMAS